VYLAKKNPLVDDRGGDVSFPSELREYTAARPNLIKFLMGSSALNLHVKSIIEQLHIIEWFRCLPFGRDGHAKVFNS